MENAYAAPHKLASCQHAGGLAGQGAGVFGRCSSPIFAACVRTRSAAGGRSSARMVHWITLAGSASPQIRMSMHGRTHNMAVLEPLTISTGKAAIDFADVRKYYGDKVVVDGLSFHVQPGECFGLLGPNGAGKTTTLKMLLGITSPDAGAIRLVDEPIPARARFARRRVGVVPQFDNLDPDFTVRENLLRVRPLFRHEPARDRGASCRRCSNSRGSKTRPTRASSELSGGMKRRLTLARALVNDPDVLVMDEPTTGLDPQARHLIWERLRSLLARGKTILLTTHFMEEAERLCDRLCVIEEGRKVAEGRPHELVESVIGCDVIEIYGPDPQSAAR